MHTIYGSLCGLPPIYNSVNSISLIILCAYQMADLILVNYNFSDYFTFIGLSITLYELLFVVKSKICIYLLRNACTYYKVKSK